MADAPPLTEALLNVVPDDLVVHGGDEIEVEAWDGDAPKSPDESKVIVAVSLLSGAPVDQLTDDDGDLILVEETDTFRYSTDEDVYQVEERDIASVNRVVADVNGAQTVLTEGEDYEVYSTEEYVTFDAIRFLDDSHDVASFGTESFGTSTFGTGGAKHGEPDDGSTVEVDYEHHMLQETQRSTWNLIWRFVVRAPRVDDGDLGATQDYRNPARLANQLQDTLIKTLAAKQGKNLWSQADGAPQPGAYVLHEVQNVGRRPSTEDGTVSDRVVDVRTSRIGITEGEKHRLAGRMDKSASPRDIRGQTP